MLVSEEDDLQVKLVPRMPQEEVVKVALRLHDVLAGGEFPAGGEAVNVGVPGKAGTPKGCAITTDAALWPTLGRASSAVK